MLNVRWSLHVCRRCKFKKSCYSRNGTLYFVDWDSTFWPWNKFTSTPSISFEYHTYVRLEFVLRHLKVRSLFALSIRKAREWEVAWRDGIFLSGFWGKLREVYLVTKVLFCIVIQLCFKKIIFKLFFMFF
jgi:hypothetical protein